MGLPTTCGRYHTARSFFDKPLILFYRGYLHRLCLHDRGSCFRATMSRSYSGLAWTLDGKWVSRLLPKVLYGGASGVTNSRIVICVEYGDGMLSVQNTIGQKIDNSPKIARIFSNLLCPQGSSRLIAIADLLPPPFDVSGIRAG